MIKREKLQQKGIKVPKGVMESGRLRLIEAVSVPKSRKEKLL